MTDPHIPYRFEVTLEVPASPEQVWEAIATHRGLESWMLPVDGEPAPGGQVVFHMGPEMSSAARITGYDAPRRLAYEEDWATLAGQPAEGVSAMATEFLVEARSGGTCVVRVVTSAYGSGADWEREAFDDMTNGWGAIIDNLRVVLTHFLGRSATIVGAAAPTGAGHPPLLDALLDDLGAGAAGRRFDGARHAGVLERRIDGHALVRLERPVDALLSFFAFTDADGAGTVALQAYLFDVHGSPVDAPAEQVRWQSWIDDVAARATMGA